MTTPELLAEIDAVLAEVDSPKPQPKFTSEWYWLEQASRPSEFTSHLFDSAHGWR